MPQCSRRDQRTTFKSRFSPFTVYVLGTELGCGVQAQEQVHFRSEPLPQLQPFNTNISKQKASSISALKGGLRGQRLTNSKEIQKGAMGALRQEVTSV